MQSGWFYYLVISLVFILSRSLGFLAAFDAWALVVLLFPQIRQHSRLSAVTLKAFQSAIQRLVIFDMDFRHYLPSLRYAP